MTKRMELNHLTIDKAINKFLEDGGIIQRLPAEIVINPNDVHSLRKVAASVLTVTSKGSSLESYLDARVGNYRYVEAFTNTSL